MPFKISKSRQYMKIFIQTLNLCDSKYFFMENMLCFFLHKCYLLCLDMFVFCLDLKRNIFSIYCLLFLTNKLLKFLLKTI